MKKFLFVGAVLLLALTIGTVGYAFAQTPDTPDPATETPTCPMHGSGFGRMGGMRGRGMMGEVLAVRQAIHDYVQPILAGKLGLTPEELSTRIGDGESVWLIAEAQGMTLQSYREMMTEVHTEALAAAVDDGALTQEQADLIREHMQNRWEKGFGPGSGMGKGGFRGGRGQ
jgi:hypothetical protein